MVEPGESGLISTIVAADPLQTQLHLSFWYVTLSISDLEVRVLGGLDVARPWTEVFRDDSYSAHSPTWLESPLSSEIGTGYPFYKIEFEVWPSNDGGMKFTGVYFAVSDTAVTQTPSPTPSSTPTASITATSAPTATSTQTPTPTAAATASPTATFTPTQTPTATTMPTVTPTATLTLVPSATATPTQMHRLTPTPTVTIPVYYLILPIVRSILPFLTHK